MRENYINSKIINLISNNYKLILIVIKNELDIYADEILHHSTNSSDSNKSRIINAQ